MGRKFMRGLEDVKYESIEIKEEDQDTEMDIDKKDTADDDEDELAPLNWREVALMIEWKKKKTPEEFDKECRELMERLAANFILLALKAHERMMISLSRRSYSLSTSSSEVDSSISSSEGTVSIQSGASQDSDFGTGRTGKILHKRYRRRRNRSFGSSTQTETELDFDYDELNETDVYQKYFGKKT